MSKKHIKDAPDPQPALLRPTRSRRSDGAESREAYETLSQVFPAHQLRFLAYAALGIMLVVVGFTFAMPIYLEYGVVRVIVCLLLSLCLSVFFFVFWPQKLEMQVIPVINLPIRVTGPAVLWCCVLLLLLNLVPVTGNTWAYFTPDMGDSRLQVPYYLQTTLERVAGGELHYRIVKEDGKPGSTWAVLVRFEPAERSIQARLRIRDYKETTVSFVRGKDTFDLSGVEREGKP
jgi:hypothetical protein